ncbi:MAG: hypothetical protein EXR86_14615 [Gammaproteobacteria bacterium]|nr:hypothetical protein [Gammaproteobacteria bacterium]
MRRRTLESEQQVQAARITQAQAATTAATATVLRARKDLQRLTGLVEDGSVPPQQRDALEAVVRVAEADLAQQRALVQQDEATRHFVIQ